MKKQNSEDILAEENTDFPTEGEEVSPFGDMTSAEERNMEDRHLSNQTSKHLEQARRYGPFTRNEEERLFRQLSETGDQSAREEIIKHNLGLVIHVAKRYANFGVPMEDLFQEGVIGLIHAIEKYDLRKGFRFSGIAFQYIKGVMIGLLERERAQVRVPRHIQRIQIAAKKLIEQALKDQNKPPTLEVVAADLGETIENVHLALVISTSADVSLQEEITAGTQTWEESIQGEVLAQPEIHLTIKQELTQRKENFARLRAKVESVCAEKSRTPKRDVEIFLAYHGILDSSRAKSGSETGKEYGVAQTRVSQIVTKMFLDLAEHGIDSSTERIRAELEILDDLEKLANT